MSSDSRGVLEELSSGTGVALHRDMASCAEASEDYGHLTRGAAAAVARPRTREEVEKLITFANNRQLRLTPRGVGHSQSGQSVAPAGGVSLDLSRMDRLEPVDVAGGTISCEPGARWREVVAAASPHGLVPPVLPLYLDLTVGGTISVGGVGPSVHRFGPLLANVTELEVVTGAGERARCNWTQERPLFDATLGNLGRCAVITRATLALRRIKPLVRTFYLLYDDVSTWLADQRLLSQSARCEYLDGFCTASIQGMRNTPVGRRPFAQWFYALHVGIEYEPGNVPEASTALEGLRPYRVVHVEDNETPRFPLRFDPRFETMHRTGAFQQAHPLFECLLPASVLGELLPKLLDALPLSIGDGHRVYRVAPRDLPRFFMVPDAPEYACFAVLPTGVPAPFLEDVLKAMRRVHAMCMEAGGKRYLAGWLAMIDAEGWRAHYGDRHEAWLAAKRQFDPRHVLQSALFDVGTP
jgi:cytokinin dehydrogenase